MPERDGDRVAVIPATAGSAETRGRRCRWVAPLDVRRQRIGRLHHGYLATADIHQADFQSGLVQICTGIHRIRVCFHSPTIGSTCGERTCRIARKCDNLLICVIFRRRTAAFPRQTAVQIDAHLDQTVSAIQRLWRVKSARTEQQRVRQIETIVWIVGLSTGASGDSPDTVRWKQTLGIRRQQGALHP
jgi:hypothetical protein